VTLDEEAERVCLDLSVFGIDPATAAHIHSGREGVAGPVVIPLAAPSSGVSQGCVDVEEDLIEDIEERPGAFYVNVHNDAFPGGAARGQLRVLRVNGERD
jgi:hypothetical protein